MVPKIIRILGLTSKEMKNENDAITQIEFSEVFWEGWRISVQVLRARVSVG
jgi:hypothetical protein